MSHLWFPITEDTLGKNAQPGEWQSNGARALKDLVSELSLHGDAREVHSLLPTPWSRALQIEEAIKTPDYPSRDQLLDELFGCLAVVGLASIYDLKLDRGILQIKKLCEDQQLAVRRFATSLWENRPKASHSVFEQLSTNEDSPWDSLIIITIRNDHESQPIGFLSPNSILCPTTHLRHRIPNVPWVKEDVKGRLRFCDPTRYLGPNKKSLANWLHRVAEHIKNCKHKANPELADALYLVLGKFTDRLAVKPDKRSRKGIPVLDLTNTPYNFLAYSADSIKSERNCCQVLLGDKAEENSKPVILVDPDMPHNLHRAASDIQLYESATLVTINKDPNQLRKRYYNKIDVITPDQLFLTKLTLLSGYPALRNSWLPDKLVDRLEMEDGDGATPLLPFSDRLQQLFSSKELKEMVSDLEVDHSKGCLVVKLTLKLKGFEEEMKYTLQRSYFLKDANVLNNIPIIAIWPFISDQSWHKYWIFSGIVDHFGINRTEEWEVHIGKFGDKEVCYFSSKSFPDLLSITVKQKPGGLIPLKSPKPIKSTGESWNVGLDFGTSFTNWAVSDDKAARTLSLELALCLVTTVDDETQHYYLDKYFLPQEMYPKGSNPPTSTSLNILGYDQSESYGKPPELFHEARLHIPQVNEKEKPHVRTGFKWEKREFQRPFLEQLALMISAHAAQAGVSEMKWSLSYPTAFSDRAKRSYEKLWKDLIERKLKKVSKLDHKIRKDRSLLSEAFAFAYCLAENKDKPFEYTACMDIGGHTTDISLWQHRKPVYQVSVPFAGQNICTKILDCSPEFASTLLGKRLPLLSMKRIMGRDKEINRLSIIDNCIRFASEDLLQDELPRLRLQKDEKREKFIGLMALATGGLYYYLGLVIRFLHKEENKLDKGSCMPVYVGGNGGQLLNWLDPDCQFNQESQVNKWLSRIQASAISLNSKPNDEGTTLSGKFKDEVAIGLVVDQDNLQEEELNDSDSKPFSGESLRINQHTFASKDRIDFSDVKDDEEVKEVELLDLKELQNYVREMVKAMEGLKDSLQINPVVYESQLLEGPLKQRVLERARDLSSRDLSSQSLGGKYQTIGNFSAEPGFFLGLRALMVELAIDWAKR